MFQMNHVLWRAPRALIVTGLLLMAAGAGLLVLDGTSASHHRRIIDNSSFTNDPPQETWSLFKGVVGNGGSPPSPQTLTWCNNLGAYSSEVSTAFSDWENAISGWTQFSSNCSSNNISVSWDTGNSICGASAWGCMDVRTNCIGCLVYDSNRDGYYLHGGIAYLNPSPPGGYSWNGTRVTEVVRHELGHLLGFDEWYVEGSGCNSTAPSTVMDLAPNNRYGCGDGSTVTSSDITDVYVTYGLYNVSSLSGFVCTTWAGGTGSF